MLKPADPAAHRDLLVGLSAADDAAVYRMSPEVAIVETVDFFPPVVDDAYTWGAVSAANAMSDVYAMGGEVMFALAVAGFPRDFPKAIIAEVFRGGAEKVAEAGGIVAGGHTVVDAEPKYGLCVTGRVHPDRVFIKGGLRPGDRVFLSKPLGVGVVTTAGKNEVASEEALAAAVASMLRLNRVAAQIASRVGVRGATDVSGFGFMGHAGEMIEASGAGLAIEASRLPLLPQALDLAAAGKFSGGMGRNRRHVEALFGQRLQSRSRLRRAERAVLGDRRGPLRPRLPNRLRPRERSLLRVLLKEGQEAGLQLGGNLDVT